MKLSALAVLVLFCSSCWGQHVTFEAIPGDQNGTQAAFAAWRSSEIARQGGRIRGDWWWGVTACDVTADGYPDLVATIHGRLGGIVLRNDFPQTGRIGYTDITSSLLSDTRLMPRADRRAHCWDFDHDGRVDIAGFSNDAKNASLFNDPGGFTRIAPMMSPIALPMAGKPSYLAPSGLTDLNGDGFLDVTDRRFDWIFQPSARTFTRRPSTYVKPTLPPEVQDLVDHNDINWRYFDCCDVTGDGLEDLLLFGYRSYSRVNFSRLLVRQPDGSLVDETVARGLPVDAQVNMIENVLGDALPEIAMSRGTAPGLYINSGGQFSRIANSSLNTEIGKHDVYPTDVDPVDFNGDGNMELIIHRSFGWLLVFEHTGSGYLPEPTLSLRGGWRADGYDVADVDQDGALDIMVGVGRGPDISFVVYRNTSTRASTGFLEPPVVFDGGVVHNASFAPSPAPVAPGSIAAVFGDGLNGGSVIHSSAIGPDGKVLTSLGGASARVNNIAAPVLYSTLGQLGIQVPFELAGESSATIRVIANGAPSTPRTFFLDNYAPGIFTLSQDGRGTVAALHEDGETLVTTEEPARLGEVVTIFATGLGPLSPPLETGSPAALHVTSSQVTVLIDGLPAELQFSGAAPGFVGLNQVNFRIPDNTRIASEIPLVLTINGRQSNAVTIPVSP